MNNRSIFPKGESLSESIEVCWLVQDNGDLGIDLFAALSLDVLFTDSVNGDQTVFGEDLGELESKWDTLSHAFDLDVSVLFENQFGEE